MAIRARSNVSLSPAKLVLSVISLVELEGGVRRDPSQSAVRRERLNGLLQTVEVLPFTVEISEIYGNVIEQLGFSRPHIIDRMIAAHALHASAALATSNIRDFSGIGGLLIEDWSVPADPA
jgi:predicted nucleic acid-binding protein